MSKYIVVWETFHSNYFTVGTVTAYLIKQGEKYVLSQLEEPRYGAERFINHHAAGKAIKSLHPNIPRKNLQIHPL